MIPSETVAVPTFGTTVLQAQKELAKFLKNGRGKCFEVDDLQGKLDRLDNEGVRLIDKTPREGLSGMIGFIHPSSTAGILYELVDRNTAKR